MVKPKRQYQNDYASVTQVLGVLRKIALENWFKYNTAEFCNRESSKGKLVGTQIHEAIEQYITTGQSSIDSEYAEEVSNALNSFIKFRTEHPEFNLKLSEIALTSEKYKYNGTIDSPNPPILLDWKTAKAKDEDVPPIYDEAKTQCSAYVNLWNELNPNELIETAYVVSFATDKVAYNMCKLEKDEIDGNFNEIFLSALKIYYYQQKQKQINKEKKNDLSNGNG
jgi:hypothetical protein